MGDNFPLKSKSFWAGIGLMVYAVLKYIYFGVFDTQAFLTGLGILGIRHAISKYVNMTQGKQ